jgi:hypothetical protein
VMPAMTLASHDESKLRRRWTAAVVMPLMRRTRTCTVGPSHGLCIAESDLQNRM